MRHWVFITLGLLLHGAVARADVDARALRAALGRVGRPLASSTRVVTLVEHDAGANVSVPGLIPLTQRFSGLRVRPRDFDDAAAALTGSRLHWSAPRHLLLDRAGDWTCLTDVHQDGTGTGQGVVMGIIDTGVDLSHPDLRNADGSTRVAWLLDFSRPPAGLQPELEESYACSNEPGFECQVLSGADIDQLLVSPDLATLPSDEIGHGTHVASLAAGNGFADDPPRYVGAAPEATLVVARVTRQTAAIDDFDILLATDFVFERAAALGMPAVVNLSLGSDFGPHDGTATIGRALSEFLNEPGRAIVVAAGNSGALYTTNAGQYVGPFGVHTDVFVPKGEGVRVPLLTPEPAGDATRTQATLFVWIGFEPGSDLRVGLDRLDGPWIEPIGRGEIHSEGEDGLEVTLLNNHHGEDSPLSSATDGAVLLLDGEWDAGRAFVLRFEGEGAANLWVQSEGDLGPAAGSVGALFPRATAAYTVNIPAVHEELIAVGASVNRDRWPSRTGIQSEIDGNALARLSEPDNPAWFSSAGPMIGGTMKPDIIAPGAFVVGAMSLRADPDLSPFSLFADSSACGTPDCSVVDDFHAVTTGTSMASPIVAGAVALLFQRNPSLTHVEARQLLQAGGRRLLESVAAEPEARSGAGMLDAASTLDALELMQTPVSRAPDPNTSNLLLAATFLRPAPESKVQGLVQLRDDEDRAVGGISGSRLRVQVDRARVSRALREQVPGLYTFEMAGVPGTGAGSARVRVLFDDEVLLHTSIAVSVDGTTSVEGHSASGGCSVQRPGRTEVALRSELPKAAPVWLLGSILLGALWSRRQVHR